MIWTPAMAVYISRNIDPYLRRDANGAPIRAFLSHQKTTDLIPVNIRQPNLENDIGIRELIRSNPDGWSENYPGLGIDIPEHCLRQLGLDDSLMDRCRDKTAIVNGASRRRRAIPPESLSGAHVRHVRGSGRRFPRSDSTAGSLFAQTDPSALDPQGDTPRRRRTSLRHQHGSEGAGSFCSIRKKYSSTHTLSASWYVPLAWPRPCRAAFVPASMPHLSHLASFAESYVMGAGPPQ